jgi:DNA polymerase III epsilon subunit-like protein
MVRNVCYCVLFAVEGRVMPQITQIAAMEIKSGEPFSTYVTPTVPISREATSVTGISMGNGEMMVNGKQVQSVSISLAVEKMTSWFSKFKNVCLVAHNGRRFDFPVLVSTMKKNGAFEKICELTFIDSLSVFRKKYPNQSLKQVDLVSMLLNESYDAHNAMSDVAALGKLMKFINLTKMDLMAHSFTPLAVANNLAFNDAKAVNLPTLGPLIYSGVMKRPTAENISGSGLNLGHLRLLNRRGGEDAIRDVFTLKTAEGIPRVTTSKKILDAVVPKICSYFDKT